MVEPRRLGKYLMFGVLNEVIHLFGSYKLYPIFAHYKQKYTMSLWTFDSNIASADFKQLFISYQSIDVCSYPNF